jgi:hypothetical protein
MARSAAESGLFIGTGIGNKSTPTKASSPCLQLARSLSLFILATPPCPSPSPRSSHYARRRQDCDCAHKRAWGAHFWSLLTSSSTLPTISDSIVGASIPISSSVTYIGNHYLHKKLLFTILLARPT